jgi:hypothetical protein
VTPFERDQGIDLSLLEPTGEGLVEASRSATNSRTRAMGAAPLRCRSAPASDPKHGVSHNCHPFETMEALGLGCEAAAEPGRFLGPNPSRIKD